MPCKYTLNTTFPQGIGHLHHQIRISDMAGNLSHLQWVPPPIEEWNLTKDCSSYARFVSTMLRKSEPGTLDMCAFDVYALHDYVDWSLPSTFQRSDENFTSSRTAMWYLSVCDEDPRATSKTWSSPCHGDPSCDTAIDFLNNTISMIFQSLQGVCLKELRSSLNVQGNADMAGIGVSRVTQSQLQSIDSI